MTGYVTMCDGRRSALPALLQWDIKLTDGDPCDGFSVCFPYERALAQTLRGAVFLPQRRTGRRFLRVWWMTMRSRSMQRGCSRK